MKDNHINISLEFEEPKGLVVIYKDEKRPNLKSLIKTIGVNDDWLLCESPFGVIFGINKDEISSFRIK